MNRKKIFSFIITLLIINLTFVFQSVQAEENFQSEHFPYSEIQIQVMPEFDNPAGWDEEQPSLLVGYYGTLVNKSGNDYDGVLEFPLPLDSTGFELYLVAEFQEENQPEVQLNYEINTEKGVISWKPTKPISKDESYQFVVEYYANPFMIAEQKSFTYSFEAKSVFEKVDILFLAPFNSEDFSINKEAVNISKSEYGEQIYQYEYTNVEPGNVLDFLVTYKKEDNSTTLSEINSGQIPNDETHAGVQEGSFATDQSQQNKSANPHPLIDPIGATIIGVSIIIAGLLVYLGLKKSSNQRSNPEQSVKKKNSQNLEDHTKADKAEKKKQLRQLLIQNKIDQKTYDEEIKKLS